MPFTYSPSLADNRDIVRFLVQDTVAASARLDDGEIAWALSTEANVYMAAARCADVLRARSKGLQSKSVGGVSLSWGPEFYEKLANELRAKGKAGYELPTAGGVYQSDRDTMREDTTLIRPSFFDGALQDPETRNQHVTGHSNESEEE